MGFENEDREEKEGKEECGCLKHFLDDLNGLFVKSLIWKMESCGRSWRDWKN